MSALRCSRRTVWDLFFFWEQKVHFRFLDFRFVCRCATFRGTPLKSFTSTTRGLEGRYPSLTNNSAQVENTYFEVMFDFGKFSAEKGAAQKSERTNLKKWCYSLLPSCCYYLGFVILQNDARACVTMVNSL